MKSRVKMQVAVSLEDNVVTLELILPDAYAAAVYHDDVVERLGSGDGLVMTLSGPPQTGRIERVKR